MVMTVKETANELAIRSLRVTQVIYKKINQLLTYIHDIEHSWEANVKVAFEDKPEDRVEKEIRA